MKNILIFDFDGVLADTCVEMIAYGEQVCAELGHPCKPSRADLEALETMSFEALGRQLGLPEALAPEYARRNLALFSNRPQPVKIFPGMGEALAQLSLNHHIGIVTGNSTPAVRRFLEHYGLSNHIEMILSSDDPGTKPEKIARMAAALANPGGEVYLIGDAVSDVRAAHQAGVKSISVAWGHQSRQKLEQAGTDYLVDSPLVLLQYFN